MAERRETYGLPDETLQLIAGSPELSIPMMQQGSAAQFATPDVRRSDLISALRNIPGAANPGFTRYANKANGRALDVNLRNTLGAMSPAKLAMQKYVAPEVTLPVAETPYVAPDRPFVPDLVYPDVINPDPIDPDPKDPELPDPPEVPKGTPLVLDPVVDPVVDPEDDPVDPGPDYIEPTELDPFVLDPFVFKEVPEREKIPTVTIEPVDPNEEFPQDDGTTQDILDLINYLNSSTGGGGKPQFDDVSWGELEF